MEKNLPAHEGTAKQASKTGSPAENKVKVGKYLKYAIGEIILVVFGILIALWINSTYQDYKNQQLETIYLTDLKRDLISDSIHLAERIQLNEGMIQSVDSIFTYLAKNELSEKELREFLGYHTKLMSESYFIPEKGTIRQLESSNSGNLISSKLFKGKLFQYHTLNDRDEKNMEASIQLYQHNFFTRDFMNVMMSEEISRLFKGEKSSMNKESIEKIKTIKGYMSSLFLKKGVTENQNKHYLIVKNLAEDLIKQIDSEL